MKKIKFDFNFLFLVFALIFGILTTANFVEVINHDLSTVSDKVSAGIRMLVVVALMVFAISRLFSKKEN